VALGSGTHDDWAPYDAVSRGTTCRPEFCLTHAQDVATARNAAHLAAQDRRVMQPRRAKPLGCAVCGERLQGVGIQIPEVPQGAVCAACHRTINDAEETGMLDDPRMTRTPKRRKRTAA
jgi:hypothetical protein